MHDMFMCRLGLFTERGDESRASLHGLQSSRSDFADYSGADGAKVRDFVLLQLSPDCPDRIESWGEGRHECDASVFSFEPLAYDAARNSSVGTPALSTPPSDGAVNASHCQSSSCFGQPKVYALSLCAAAFTSRKRLALLLTVSLNTPSHRAISDCCAGRLRRHALANHGASMALKSPPLVDASFSALPRSIQRPDQQIGFHPFKGFSIKDQQ